MSTKNSRGDSLRHRSTFNATRLFLEKFRKISFGWRIVIVLGVSNESTFIFTFRTVSSQRWINSDEFKRKSFDENSKFFIVQRILRLKMKVPAFFYKSKFFSGSTIDFSSNRENFVHFSWRRRVDLNEMKKIFLFGKFDRIQFSSLFSYWIKKFREKCVFKQKKIVLVWRKSCLHPRLLSYVFLDPRRRSQSDWSVNDSL